MSANVIFGRYQTTLIGIGIRTELAVREVFFVSASLQISDCLLPPRGNLLQFSAAETQRLAPILSGKEEVNRNFGLLWITLMHQPRVKFHLRVIYRHI